MTDRHPHFGWVSGTRWIPRSSTRYRSGMGIVLKSVPERTAKAVKHYWRTLERQAVRQAPERADRGNRSAVTGGKQMDGFCHLVQSLLLENGVEEVCVYATAKLELPGYFRPTKKWDMVVVQDGRLLAALEFKSQRGPSFGNNLNNRTEEAVGTAQDLWTAYREMAFGKEHPRPWLGWVMLLEDCAKSVKPVRASEPHFKVFPEFRGASYARRYELMLRKLVLEKMYDAAAFLTATAEGGLKGKYQEPAADLTMQRLLASLAGHAVGVAAGG